MTKEEVLNNLTELRKSLEEDGILEGDIGMSLLFSDILDAMGLDESETRAVLGAECMQAITAWQRTRAWILKEEKESTASKPEQVSLAALVA